MNLFGRTKPTTTVRIEATVQWHMAFDQTSELWVGVCPALNLNALGNTFMELQESANEAIQLLLTDLFETGDLEAFLRRNRWSLVNHLPAKGHSVRFDVPFGVQREASAQALVTH